MAQDDIVILCDPAVLSGKTQSRLASRTTKSGAVRMRIEVESTPLIHEFDPKSLGAPVAMAMAEAYRKKIRGIAATVSARTLEYRKEAARAFAKGAAWAQKRYAGGRIGAMPPDSSSRAFNDSGRFAQSITVNGSGDAWNINVAANRLDSSTTSGELGVRRIWQRLVSLVPEFGQPLLLFNDRDVVKGLQESLGQMIVKAEMRRDQLTEAAARAKLAAIRQIVQSALGLLG